MSTCGIPDDFAKGASVYETAFKTMTGAMTGNAGANLPFASPALFMAGPAIGLAMVAQYWGTVIGTLHGAAASSKKAPVASKKAVERSACGRPHDPTAGSSAAPGALPGRGS